MAISHRNALDPRECLQLRTAKGCADDLIFGLLTGTERNKMHAWMFHGSA